jgi:hypothetical protein
LHFDAIVKPIRKPCRYTFGQQGLVSDQDFGFGPAGGGQKKPPGQAGRFFAATAPKHREA